jgi:hypothetical protein
MELSDLVKKDETRVEAKVKAQYSDYSETLNAIEHSTI